MLLDYINKKMPKTMQQIQNKIPSIKGYKKLHSTIYDFKKNSYKQDGSSLFITLLSL